MRHHTKLAWMLVIVSSTFLGSTSAKAQQLLFTLSGVAFADNAVATGSFIFDPSTNTFGDFNITTTVGITGDNYVGSDYSSLAGTKATYSEGNPNAYVFNNFPFGLNDNHYLSLAVAVVITTPGTYALLPGNSTAQGEFGNSGEFVDSSFDVRLITSGNLIVTAVPEPQTWALLAAGLAILLSTPRGRPRRT